MKLPIGICTCGNDKLTPITAGKLISYSEPDMKLILESEFCVGKFDHTLTDNIYRSIRNKQPILLENANIYNKPPLNELAVWLSYKWPINSNIKIKFLQRDKYLETYIIDAAKEWEKYAKINFDFIEVGDADVRISFVPDGTSWSKIGTACQAETDQTKATVNFGWFNRGTDIAEIRRTTLHEFGHVLGCIHEHQNPDGQIPWDVNKIMQDYLSNGKSLDWIKINILDKFPASELTNSNYDKDSIMHYPIEAKHTKTGEEVGVNWDLSNKDKEFIKMCYPF